MSIEKFLKSASKTISKENEIKEIDIEQSFCEYAKSRRCLALKLVLFMKRGFPDRTVLCPGARIIFIEFKRKNKTPSALQIKIKKTLMSFGFEYHIADEVGQAERALDNFLKISK